MQRGAGPAVEFGLCHDGGAHRIEFGVAHGGPEVSFVERAGVVATVPDMRGALARVEEGA